MSERYARITNSTIYDGGLSDKAVRALLVLITMADKDGCCYPSQETIASRMNRARKNANEAVRELSQAGYITISIHGNGRLYRIIKGSPVGTKTYLCNEIVTQDSAETTTQCNEIVTTQCNEIVTALYIDELEPLELEKEEEEETPTPFFAETEKADQGGGLPPLALKNPFPPPKIPKPPPEDRLASMFDMFWQAFPRQRRGGRNTALVAYRKAVKEGRGTPEEIQQGVESYGKSHEVAAGYAKGCAAWLNDDRWACDYRPPHPAAKAASPLMPAGKGDAYVAGIFSAIREATGEEPQPQGFYPDGRSGGAGDMPGALLDAGTDGSGSAWTGRDSAPGQHGYGGVPHRQAGNF